MKAMGVVRRLLVSAAAVGLCLPQTVLAAAAGSGQRPAVVDVALIDGGLLVGQVVDAQGAGLSRTPVSVWAQDREIARTATDEAGDFAVRGLRGGVYRVAAANRYGTFRLWAPGSAPPTAQQGVRVVAGQDTVRGQFCDFGCLPACMPACLPCSPCGGKLGFWLSNPWVVAGIVATAVAIPVAIHNAKRPSSP